MSVGDKLELKEKLYNAAFRLHAREMVATISDTFEINEIIQKINYLKNNVPWKYGKIDLTKDDVRQILIEDPEIKTLGRRTKSNGSEIWQYIKYDSWVMGQLTRKGFPKPVQGYFATRYVKLEAKAGNGKINHFLKQNYFVNN